MFGRGTREELDDDEAELLARRLREAIKREVDLVWEKEGVDLFESSAGGGGGSGSGVGAAVHERDRSRGRL